MTACRSLVSFQTQNEFHATLLLRYKNECVQMVRAAISNTEISDQTIALALVLAAEEVRLFNFCAYFTDMRPMN